MKKAHRILSVLLALVMVLGLIPTALAAAPTEDELDDALNVSGGQLEFKNDRSHPWEVITKDGRTYVGSTIRGLNKTSAEFSTKLKLEKGQVVRFDYKLSCEVLGDSLYFSVDGTPIETWYAQQDDDLDNMPWKSYTYTPTESGAYTFSWGYRKDDADYGEIGDDAVYVDNIEVLNGETYEVVYRVDGGTFADGTTEKRASYAPGAKLTQGDVPQLVPGSGKELLGWQLNDTDEYVTPVNRTVTGSVTFTARFVTPDASTPNATIILESHNVYDTGTGNVMLFDPSCKAYGPVFTPGIMKEPISSSGWPAYNWSEYFPYTFPYGNDGTMECTSIVIDGQVSGSLPAGTYDWAIASPSYMEYNWVVVDDFTYNTPGDDTYFAGGYTYHFVVEKYKSTRDCMKLYITKGAQTPDQDGQATVTFQSGEHGSLEGSTTYTARNTSFIPLSAVPSPRAESGYRFAGWYQVQADGSQEAADPIKANIHGNTTYVARFEPISQEYATIILESRNAYQSLFDFIGYKGRGVGYTLLLDSDRNTYGSVIPGNGYGGMLELNGKSLSDYFEYIVPAGFDGNPESDLVVIDGTAKLKVPAGTYDMAVCAVFHQEFCDAMSDDYTTYTPGCYAATELTPNWKMGGYGMRHDVTFEAGKTYRFVATDTGGTDFVTLEVTDGCAHTDAGPLEQVEPTCTQPGRVACWYCPECGVYFRDETLSEELTEQELTIPALNHDFDEGVITTEPSCTAPGVRTYTCQRPNCGEMKTEEIPALGHRASDAWSSDESGHWHICTICGQDIPDTRSAHTPDRDQATEEHGITCTVCGYVMAPPLGHTHVYTDTVVAPTCTESGYTLHTCACGHSYRDSETAPLGHDFGAWTVKTPTSCTENGQSVRTCTRCGAVEIRIDAAAGHVDADNDGRCDICGADLSAEPATPAQPAKPGVKTGDESCLVLWTAAMSECGLAACLLLRRRKLS